MPSQLQDGRPDLSAEDRLCGQGHAIPDRRGRRSGRERVAADGIDLMDEVCLAKIPGETVSMRCGGDGFAVFFGLAKPVRTPVIGSQVRRW